MFKTVAPTAALALVSLLTVTGCSLVQGTYYPEGRGFPSRDQPAEMTLSSASELEEQGYRQIGVITRLWDPEDEKEALFLDFRSDSDDLPSTDPFHKGFLPACVNRPARRAAIYSGWKLRAFLPTKARFCLSTKRVPFGAKRQIRWNSND
ncbi:MAG: hypothetical protein R3F37_10455 [Candidatus Competibacteraceae bacterium]